MMTPLKTSIGVSNSGNQMIRYLGMLTLKSCLRFALHFEKSPKQICLKYNFCTVKSSKMSFTPEFLFLFQQLGTVSGSSVLTERHVINELHGVKMIILLLNMIFLI